MLYGTVAVLTYSSYEEELYYVRCSSWFEASKKQIENEKNELYKKIRLLLPPSLVMSVGVDDSQSFQIIKTRNIWKERLLSCRPFLKREKEVTGFF
jgi:hypothetical protein